jgi:hypothetical protein
MGGCSGGFSLKILITSKKNRADITIRAMRRSRGMHICHVDGFRQKSCFAGDQTGGGDSGSGGSVSKPSSDRLPIVNRLVIMNVSI